ncbi:ankyrin [Rhizoclosmatium globosum]|uniref:Ankyrin n=1 Tax=Rhizoclosmatium globosum TaxID=329046 RepID=A0A1Y2CWT4_9FUNG|nr:ankyrin [Rhizoclosmatium globosum]|eukprot:ORY51480.1 ankyrin [Rhizoclosmatium globosum]
MGRVWGDGNTVLHLASFLGMSDLVKRLLELGANPNKKNGRLYKPVDCCDTDETRNVFSTVTELTRSNFNQPNYVTNSFGSLSSLNSISSKYIPDTSNSILTKRSSSLYWKEGVRSISQPSTPTSSQTFTLKKQNNLPNTPSRHQKTKSLDERILLVNLKDQLASFSGNMPLTSSLDSLTETKPQTNEESAPKRPKKTVSFSPDTILLDICQHGQEADETPLQTFQKTITLLPTTCDAANIISPQQNLTLLHLASAYGHLDIVQELLQRVEVQVNARDREGWTPLHCACAEGHLDVIKELCGAVGWITENGEKVSEVEEGDVTRMYWVVDGPIDVDAVNGDGETAEMVALEDKREEISLILKGR